MTRNRFAGSSEKGGRPALPLPVTLAATSLTAIFVAMGTVALLDGAARILPTREVKVEIVDRDRIERPSANRSAGLWERNYRVAVEFEDGSRRKLACRKELYEEAGGAGRHLGEATMALSVLADRPMSLNLTTASLATVPLLGIEGKATTRAHPLTMPISGILVAALFCWGVAAWLVWRLRRLEGFRWGVFALGMAVAVLVAFGWWAKSV